MRPIGNYVLPFDDLKFTCLFVYQIEHMVNRVVSGNQGPLSDKKN